MTPLARTLVAPADPGREVQAREFITAVAVAVAQARADHERGVCHLSEWSCSDCQGGVVSVLNYTTSIGATKTVGEMQTMLAKHGASRIAVDYTSGRPSALSFALATPHGARHFTLPVNVDAMHRLLVSEDEAGRLRSGAKATRSSWEQAERVAWRVIKDWLAAQLALVATEMVGLDQVMLPYLHVDDSGRTLYASYKEREAVAALGPGDAS